MSPRRGSLPLLVIRPLRPRVGTLGWVISPLQGFTLLNVLVVVCCGGCLVAADLANPPPSEYEDVHIRFKRTNF